MRRAARTDANLTEIMKAARKMGFRVFVCNDQLCDLIAQKHGVTELWEVKQAKGRFTKLQKEMREAGWQIRTVRSIDDLLNPSVEGK